MCMYPQNVPMWTRSVANKMVNGELKYNQNAKHPTETMQVPCGKCPDCRRLRAMQWSFRLSKEKSYSAYFLTFTYREEDLPKNNQLSKEHQRLFLKNLRRQIDYLYQTWEPDFKKYGKHEPVMIDHYQRMKEAHQTKERRLKYYWIGEYGTKNGRPHYHAIMYNIPKPIIEKLPEIWNKGHIKVGNVTPKSIRYVANYVQQLDYEKDQSIREYATMSRGLGLDYIQKNESTHRKRINNTVNYNGFDIPMPRYYAERAHNQEERTFIGELNKERALNSIAEQKQDCEKKGISYDTWLQAKNRDKQRKFNNHKKRRQ